MSGANKLKLTTRKIGEIKLYENNPRDNDRAVDAVAASIKSFGFKVPIIIDKDGVVVCGHTRVKASRKLGLEEVPCIVADDLTDEQIKAFRLADNKVGELAGWDMERLSEELSLIDMDMSEFGFEDLEKEMEREALEDDFDENEPLPENPYAKRGDVFELRGHRLMCGDSTKQEDVAILLNGKLADMAVTDPPYNVNYGQKGKDYRERGGYGCGMDDRSIMNDNMEDGDFLAFLRGAFACLRDSLKPGGAFYIWHSDSNRGTFEAAAKAEGLTVRQTIIWLKNAFTLGRQDYQWIHEPCLYGWKDGAGHYFVDDRTQDTVWQYAKPQSNDLHPTMKPVELFGKSIRNSSRKGETVLDLFGGSGTTMIACEQMGRNALLMELDERYADVIVRRFLRFAQSREGCFLVREGKRTPLEEIPDYCEG